MVTLASEFPATNQGAASDLRGLSSDTKPTNVPNGSTFAEIDTGNIYMFDGSSKTWKAW